MFFPVSGENGKRAYVNLDQIFALVESGNNTIAISVGGAQFAITIPLNEIMDKIEAVEIMEDDTEEE